MPTGRRPRQTLRHRNFSFKNSVSSLFKPKLTRPQFPHSLCFALGFISEKKLSETLITTINV
jgi:hypothetical protein